MCPSRAIEPWSLNHNDDPRNGLGLCALCHWAFDAGLVGVTAQLRVVTSPLLAAGENLPAHLVTLHEREIFRPANASFWPSPQWLAWRQREMFRGRG